MKAYIITLVLLLSASCPTHSDQNNEVEEYLIDLSTITTSLLCSNDRFLTMTNKTTDECEPLLQAETEFCNNLVRPFVPIGEFEDIRDKLEKISHLYISCLKGNGFESSLSDTIK